MNARWTLAVFLLSIMGCAPAVDKHNEITASRVPQEFGQFKRRESPNDYLVCPADYCRNATPDRLSPQLPISAANLRIRLDILLAKEPRTRIIFDNGANLVIEQRSAIFRFPDFIDVELIDLGPTKSTLAIFSRSKYGYYDFGANKRRIDAWLRELVSSPK